MLLSYLEHRLGHLENYLIYYLEKYCLDQSIHITLHFILKTEALLKTQIHGLLALEPMKQRRLQPCFCYQIESNQIFFWILLSKKYIFYIMKINNSRGTMTNSSAKTEALVLSYPHSTRMERTYPS